MKKKNISVIIHSEIVSILLILSLNQISNSLIMRCGAIVCTNRIQSLCEKDKYFISLNSYFVFIAQVTILSILLILNNFPFCCKLNNLTVRSLIFNYKYTLKRLLITIIFNIHHLFISLF